MPLASHKRVWSLAVALSSVVSCGGRLLVALALRLVTPSAAVREPDRRLCKPDDTWAMVPYSPPEARPPRPEPMSVPKHVRCWSELPRELLLPIARRQATGPELLNLALVCKAYRSEVDSESIWQQLCVLKFGVDPSVSPPSWKDLYRFNHELLYDHVLHATVNVLRDMRFQQGRPLRFQLPMHA